MEISEIIHGDKFAALCDFSIVDGMEPQAIPRNRGIRLVFCKQDRVAWFFRYIKEYGEKLILVTHNADHNVAEFLEKALPPNVVHWFAQNVVIESERITPIPIGVERPGVGKSSDYAAIIRAREKRKDCPPRKKYLLAINPNTNPACRMPITERLKGIGAVTVVYDLSFEDYLDAIVDHEFVISPPGNGYDCHRTWEALYIGAIPIVWNLSPALFTGVPAVLVDSTEELINLIQQDAIIPPSFKDIPRLKFDYWKQLILGMRSNSC